MRFLEGYIYIYFLISSLTIPQPNLGKGESPIYPMIITAFNWISSPKVTRREPKESLVGNLEVTQKGAS